MNQEKAGFREQAVNKIVALAISSQLKRAADVEVQIKTDLNKIMKGKLDSIGIKIRGLLTQQNLEAEELHLQIGQVQVKVGSAIRGKIILVNPSEGTLRLVINEAIFASALNTETIYSTLQPQVTVNGIDTVNHQLVSCSLLDNKILLEIYQHQSNIDVSPRSQFAITPEISADQTEVVLQNVQTIAGELPDPQCVMAIVSRLQELLSLQEFAQKGTFLKIQSVAIAAGKLTLDSTAYIECFPV